MRYSGYLSLIPKATCSALSILLYIIRRTFLVFCISLGSPSRSLKNFELTFVLSVAFHTIICLVYRSYLDLLLYLAFRNITLTEFRFALLILNVINCELFSDSWLLFSKVSDNENKRCISSSADIKVYI